MLVRKPDARVVRRRPLRYGGVLLEGERDSLSTALNVLSLAATFGGPRLRVPGRTPFSLPGLRRPAPSKPGSHPGVRVRVRAVHRICVFLLTRIKKCDDRNGHTKTAVASGRRPS